MRAITTDRTIIKPRVCSPGRTMSGLHIDKTKPTLKHVQTWLPANYYQARVKPAINIGVSSSCTFLKKVILVQNGEIMIQTSRNLELTSLWQSRIVSQVPKNVPGCLLSCCETGQSKLPVAVSHLAVIAKTCLIGRGLPVTQPVTLHAFAIQHIFSS